MQSRVIIITTKGIRLSLSVKLNDFTKLQIQSTSPSFSCLVYIYSFSSPFSSKRHSKQCINKHVAVKVKTEHRCSWAELPVNDQSQV